MPTYDYKREDGTIFEVEQKMSDERLTVCPTTGQKVERIISKRRTPFGFKARSRGSEYTEWF